MQFILSPNSIGDYRLFQKAKALPRYRLRGCILDVPDEYASLIGVAPKQSADVAPYTPAPGMFDYQRDLTSIAVRKRKFALFVDCGLGKTLMLLDFMRHAREQIGDKRALIVSPLMVVRQTIEEAKRFYGDSLPIEQVTAANLPAWLNGKGGIGITNYEAITDSVDPGNLGALALDESSTLKSFGGKWGTRLIEMGRGVDWKLCLTGTPAPNDRIEYANHAVFLDRFPTVNAFLAKYFVNRGQTGERWELKGHALPDFYRQLSDWCVFVSRPAVYGWKDNAGTLPPINVHIHDVPMTDEQRDASMKLTGGMFGEAGGFVQRGKLARLAKGIGDDGSAVPTNKLTYMRELIESFGRESSIVWCNYNREQDMVAAALGKFGIANIDGSTPMSDRVQLIDDFKAGRRRVLVSKPKVLGFGLNLQVATRQVFSSLVDSYESYYQAVKRSNRIGSTRPLHVHIPVTDIERPMVANVLRKADRVQVDTDAQEALFKTHWRALTAAA